MQGFICISPGSAAQYAEERRLNGADVFLLRNDIRDARGFFESLRESVPLDPPLAAVALKWDALEDSLWAGLHAEQKSKRVVVWPRADGMQSASPADFEIAVGILARVAAAPTDSAGVEFALEGVDLE